MNGQISGSNMEMLLGNFRPPRKDTIPVESAASLISEATDMNGLDASLYTDIQAILLNIGKQFAETMRNGAATAALASKIAAYQELVFTSLCVVMLHYGIPQDVVNSLMHFKVSNSPRKNLKRLRQGAM